MALPTYPDDTVIDAPKWNAHVNQINTNTSDVATLQDRSFSPTAVTLVQSSIQTVGNEIDTAVSNWTTFGTMAGNGLWSPGDDFVTIPSTGEYSITETVVFAANGTNGSTSGQRVLYINVNDYAPAADGSNVLSSSIYGPSNSYVGFPSPDGVEVTGGVPIPASWGGTLSAGTRIYMTVWQDSGGDLDTMTGYAGQTILSVVRMS